jgi:Bacterial regulatory helix-turn-helix protein, lysR family
MRYPYLNLSRIFDTLIELRSVTRTAERLALTQTAVGHAFGRLRREVDDPLSCAVLTGRNRRRVPTRLHRRYAKDCVSFAAH